VPIHAPKIAVLGIWPPESYINKPHKRHPCMERRRMP